LVRAVSVSNCTSKEAFPGPAWAEEHGGEGGEGGGGRVFLEDLLGDGRGFSLEGEELPEAVAVEGGSGEPRGEEDGEKAGGSGKVASRTSLRKERRVWESQQVTSVSTPLFPAT
jgi:hypothetical protein